jgi:hypothetical protein
MLPLVKILSFLMLIGISINGWSFTKSEYNSARIFIASLPDSTDIIQLEEITVKARKRHKMSDNQYSRMVTKIRKVYPFAKEASRELQLYNEKFQFSNDPRLRKQYVKKVEKELFAKHENDIRHLTISEGRYLMLLIDRETGETPYNLINEIKGSFPAHFWQGIAKVFQNDLKEHYDPVYKHYMIEQIVLMIEKENL